MTIVIAKEFHSAHGGHCRQWSSVYSTKRLTHKLGTPPDPAEAQAWFDNSCPWEETRHSGFFSNYERAESALEYASSHVCLPRVHELEQLAGARIYFLGDSVMRQFSQSFLCRLRHSGSVREDNISWSQQHPPPKNGRGWGACSSSPGSVSLRHCFMRDGCVTFRRDVRVCYYADTSCKADFASRRLRPWLDLRAREHGAGSHTFVVMTNGMHVKCNEFWWGHLNKTYEATMQGAVLPRSKFTVVYKDLDATHFPTKDGSYNASADRSKWDCKPASSTDPPQPQRNMELRSGLPVARRLGWRVLETFAESKANAAPLHATQAPVPSRTKPVDCLHWMMPGVPDVWSDKLIKLLGSIVGQGGAGGAGLAS